MGRGVCHEAYLQVRSSSNSLVPSIGYYNHRNMIDVRLVLTAERNDGNEKYRQFNGGICDRDTAGNPFCSLSSDIGPCLGSNMYSQPAVHREARVLFPSLCALMAYITRSVRRFLHTSM